MRSSFSLFFLLLFLPSAVFAVECFDGCGSCAFFEEKLTSTSNHFLDSTYSDVSALESSCQSDNGGTPCSCHCGNHPWAGYYHWCYRWQNFPSVAAYYVLCQDCGSDYDSATGLCPSCGGCPDSDSDGSPDTCDPCPDDPNISQSEICIHSVTSTCGGAGTYVAGDTCGYTETSCTGSPVLNQADEKYIPDEQDGGWHCCEQTGCYAKPCEVDPDTCEETGCVCPDGSESCAECQDPDCVCPDGSPDCIECQVPDDPANPYNPNGSGGTPGDPSEPGTGDPGSKIPDEIQVGACVFDLRDIKAYLLSEESFPFNFMYELYSVLQPLFNASGGPPVFNLEITPDNGKWDFFSSPVSITIDFEEYPLLNSFAGLVRWLQILIIVVMVISYAITRYQEYYK
jgi:hypothetical protein